MPSIVANRGRSRGRGRGRGHARGRGGGVTVVRYILPDNGGRESETTDETQSVASFSVASETETNSSDPESEPELDRPRRRFRRRYPRAPGSDTDTDSDSDTESSGSDSEQDSHLWPENPRTFFCARIAVPVPEIIQTAVLKFLQAEHRHRAMNDSQARAVCIAAAMLLEAPYAVAIADETDSEGIQAQFQRFKQPLKDWAERTGFDVHFRQLITRRVRRPLPNSAFVRMRRESMRRAARTQRRTEEEAQILEEAVAAET